MCAVPGIVRFLRACRILSLLSSSARRICPECLHWAERSWLRQDQSQPAGFVNYKGARRKGPYPFLTTRLMTPCCGGIAGSVRPQAAVAKAPAFAALRSQRSAVGALQMGKGIDFPQVIEQLRALHLRLMLPCVHAHVHADPLARNMHAMHLHASAEGREWAA